MGVILEEKAQDRIPVITKARVIDPDNRVIRYIGTTNEEDRYGDVVDPAGGKFKNYKKNPVFLWAHDHGQPPIGKCIKLETFSDRVEFDIQFAETPFALEIYGLYKDGYLNCTSIGFISLESKVREATIYEFNNDGFCTPKEHTSWEMLELSAVPIPANPGAGIAENNQTSYSVEDVYETVHSNGGYRGVGQLVLRSFSATKLPNFRNWISEESEVSDSEVIKGVVSAKKYPLQDKSTPWSGSEARKEFAEYAGGPDKDKIKWSKYKLCFAYVMDGQEDSFGGYKLPHHRVVGGKIYTNWNGVKAAMGALMGARGGLSVPEEDRKKIYNHLASHYREFDEIPPDYKSYNQCLEGEEMADKNVTNKAGKVLSQSTKIKMQEAMAHHQKGMDCLKSMIEDDDSVGSGAANVVVPPEDSTKYSPVDPNGAGKKYNVSKGKKKEDDEEDDEDRDKDEDDKKSVDADPNIPKPGRKSKDDNDDDDDDEDKPKAKKPAKDDKSIVESVTKLLDSITELVNRSKNPKNTDPEDPPEAIEPPEGKKKKAKPDDSDEDDGKDDDEDDKPKKDDKNPKDKKSLENKAKKKPVPPSPNAAPEDGPDDSTKELDDDEDCEDDMDSEDSEKKKKKKSTDLTADGGNGDGDGDYEPKKPQKGKKDEDSEEKSEDDEDDEKSKPKKSKKDDDFTADDPPKKDKKNFVTISDELAAYLPKEEKMVKLPDDLAAFLKTLE